MARDQVGPARRLLVPLGLDPVLSQQRLDVRDACLFVSGWVRRVETDQVTQKLDWIGHSSSRASATFRSINPRYMLTLGPYDETPI